MEAVFSRRKLVSPAELRELCQRSDLMGTLQMSGHVGAILGAGCLHYLAAGTLWVLPTGFVLGVLLNFLYAAQHELSHSTVFKTRSINAHFGRAIGFVQFFPRDFDQIMHFAHHQWTQDWERDGELVREPYTLRTYLMWLFGITYWYNRVVGLVRRARGIILEPYIRRDEEAKVIHESRVHAVIYAMLAVSSVIFGFWEWIVFFWIAPMILTKPLHQLQNTIEHLGLSHENNILENTRSTRTNAVMRWLCWQMPYHTAHHAFPAVPFWKLRQLNSRIESVTGQVHRMGWIEFQIEVIRKLAKKPENEYAMNEVWVVPRGGGRSTRIPAEG